MFDRISFSSFFPLVWFWKIIKIDGNFMHDFTADYTSRGVGQITRRESETEKHVGSDHKKLQRNARSAAHDNAKPGSTES